jgi:DNA-directed RNA polymerase specialized sigma24 family protein
MYRYQLGHSYDEMAKIFGRKANTLQARTKRALRRLHECIEACMNGKRGK